MAPGPYNRGGPYRGPSNRPRRGIAPAFVSDISAFDLGWFVPLSEPAAYQIEPGLSAAWSPYTSGASLPQIKPDMWHMQLAEPQRRRDIPVADQAPAFTIDTRTPEDPTKTFWFNWLSEPQRRRDMPTADQPWPFTADTRLPQNLAEAFWFNPLSEPQRRRDIPTADQPWNFTTDYSHPTPQADSWHQALAEPQRNKQPVTWHQFFATDTRVPANLAESFWFNPLSEPQRRKDIPQSNQPWDFTMDWKWSSPTVVVNAFNPLSDPIQIQVGLDAPYTQFATGVFSPTINNLTNFWFSPLSEPQRRRDFLTAEQQTQTMDWFVPPVVTVNIGWLTSLADPIQIETGLGSQHMQVTAVGPGIAQDLQLFWMQWLAEPVQERDQGLTAPWTAFSTGVFAPTINNLTNFWFNPLSDPIRRADTPQLRPWDFTTSVLFTPAITDLRNFWFSPFSEPVRRKDMPAADQPWTFTTDWSHPTPQADSWHMQLAEPRWQRVLPAAENPFFITDYSHPTPQADSWHQQLSEPQRRRDMIAADQPWPFTMDWRWQAPPNAGNWHMQLSEPQRRRDMTAADQPWPFTIDTRTPATPSQIPAWYNFLSEPVRPKLGLIPAAQQFFTMDWKWAAPAPVTFKYSFSLIEAGDFGRFTLSELSTSSGAKVGIEEIRIGTSANVGISEIISP